MQSPASGMASSQETGPLFVVSMWRSGSSLLYALLNKHPQVGLTYEADLLLLRPVFWKLGGARDWAERWEFWNQALSRHGLEAEDFSDSRTNFPQAFESAHKRFAERKGASIWGDKSPNYYDRLREVAETFPGARFILVWRDPLATANSIVRAARSGNSYFGRKGSTLRGLVGYEVFKRQCEWLRAHGKPVLEVSYEELVSNISCVMQEVCRFLDIEFIEELAKLEGSDRSAVYAGEHHAMLKGNEIVAGPRPMVVNEKLRAKIDRYVKLWRREYGGDWPPFHRFEGIDVAVAGSLERNLDAVFYRALRAYDRFTAFCFSVAPVWLLAGYRNRKYRKPSASTELIPGAKAVSPEEA